jgi:hypothetical protein
MAASNPGGGSTFWVDGVPVEVMRKDSGIDTGTETFWIDGISIMLLFPPESSSAFFMLFEW